LRLAALSPGRFPWPLSCSCPFPSLCCPARTRAHNSAQLARLALSDFQKSDVAGENAERRRFGKLRARRRARRLAPNACRFDLPEPFRVKVVRLGVSLKAGCSGRAVGPVDARATCRTAAARHFRRRTWPKFGFRRLLEQCRRAKSGLRARLRPPVALSFRGERPPFQSIAAAGGRAVRRAYGGAVAFVGTAPRHGSERITSTAAARFGVKTCIRAGFGEA
jgi:hypothetical protein